MTEFIQTHWTSIIGTAMGLLYLYLEYKAKITMWIASMAMAAFYIYIFYTTQLYASMGIYIYFFFASIYGWIAWTRKQKNQESADYFIVLMSPKYIPVILISTVITFGIIYMILIYFTTNQSYITAGDALTTSLNIVALWMASRRWAEQWLLLIPANAISAALLFIQNDSISACLFIIFFIVSIFGYFNWRKLALSYKISESDSFSN